jgi:hypothetical protein
MGWTGRHEIRTLEVMRPVLAMVVLTLVVAPGCSNRSPSTPSSAPQDVAGTWAGDLTVERISTRTTWTLTETSTSVFGPVLVLLSNGIVLLNGTLAGSLTGTALSYTITVLSGGIPSNPTCTGQFAGSATLSTGTVSTLAGSYALVSSTCPSPFSTANFTLTRQ